MIRSTYIVGSLRNPLIPAIACELRERTGLIEVFDDWYSPGPDTDEYWRQHELARGRNFREALKGWHARDVFEFDKRHLDRLDSAVLVLPAGKSAHLELGYVLGMGKPGFILLESDLVERFDVMYGFATDILASMDELVHAFKEYE